jgi:hypothetical protein
MISIEGILVTDDDARTLVDLLSRINSYELSVAAAIVNQALVDHANVVALNEDDCAAIRSVLDDAPKGLRPLRKALRDRV